MQFRFTSARDRDACMSYCTEILASRRAQPTIDYMTKLINLQPNSPSDTLREFWDSFLCLIASTYKNKSVDDLKPDYPWGCWQLNVQSAIDEAPTIWKGQVSRHDKGAYQIHTYWDPLTPNTPSTGNPEGDDNKITWELMVAKQQGRDVLVGAVNVGEIDATCMVPHLPNFAATNEGSMLLAKWSLNAKKGLSQWQRRPDPIRIKAISNFIDSSDDNLIINSIMLYIPKEAKGVTIEKEGKLAKITIDPAQFLAPLGDNLTDVIIKEKNGKVTYYDQRPIWIVDGQHRTRGMVLSNRGFSLDVPVVVTHGGGDDVIELEEVAKVFTEINTLAKPLDSFQQHYLSHKFSIVSSDKDRTYGPPELGLDEKDRKNRLANIRMYKLASMLTKDKGGPFENGVQLIDGMGAAIKTRIRINEFFKQMKPLFMTGIYSDPELTIEEIHEDFSNYLSAWQNTANHHSWEHMPNRPRWKPNRGNSSELEGSQAIVWIIFKTFEFIKRVATKRGLEFSEKTYTEILAPVRGIDWYSKELEKRFEQQYRPASEFMSIWIKQAIMNETIRSKSEVASIKVEDVHHGMALYAKPSNPVITFNKGALSTSITLTWEHGNVYKQPSECYILKNNQKIDVDDVEWDFSIPDGTEEGPSTATYTINVDNFEDEDWEIIVNTRTIKPTGEIVITADTLK